MAILPLANSLKTIEVPICFPIMLSELYDAIVLMNFPVIAIQGFQWSGCIPLKRQL
jgi:hypothetical protein